MKQPAEPVYSQASAVGNDVLWQAREDPQRLAEMVATEKKLRACRDLWGAGGDIQVLACK